MNSVKNVWTKIKNIKHYQIIVAGIVCVVLCLIYFSFFQSKQNNKNEENSTEEYSSAVEYVDYLENKLSNVLSKISGVGEVNVVITLESGFSFEYATDSETKTTITNGTETTITTETVILVSNEPVVMKEIYPVLKGVVIVAKGAEDFSIKMNILTAVETVLEIDRNNITILA